MKDYVCLEKNNEAYDICVLLRRSTKWKNFWFLTHKALKPEVANAIVDALVVAGFEKVNKALDVKIK